MHLNPPVIIAVFLLMTIRIQASTCYHLPAVDAPMASGSCMRFAECCGISVTRSGPQGMAGVQYLGGIQGPYCYDNQNGTVNAGLEFGSWEVLAI